VLAPELLLLDEPFAALDAPTREALADDLLPLLRETATTTVLVTHDRDEALALSDRIGVVLDGRLAQLDTPERVLTEPASEAVAAFFRRRRRRGADVPPCDKMPELTK
jgi:ABC-type proline/glycine betaine transport system ATPase subunit